MGKVSPFLIEFYKKKNIDQTREILRRTAVFTFWFKLRFLYYTNNWVYTTNHRRIAVNYFWFVILSGIVGMVLATVIRLELAYPGVGIFAGDSLQYLSLASAHGVIMVFFMIMPLLFGAFANFLLPTQLGVHDVAFPRLNSAAFWFVPGGLIMLAQLVCIDRRYQRMNCFNIREIQSLLKQRFFDDLVSTADHRVLAPQTILNLRHKLHNSKAVEFNNFLFYNYSLELNFKKRSNIFENNESEYVYMGTNSFTFYSINLTQFLGFIETLSDSYVLLFYNLSEHATLTKFFKDHFLIFFLFFSDFKVNLKINFFYYIYELYDIYIYKFIVFNLNDILLSFIFNFFNLFFDYTYVLDYAQYNNTFSLIYFVLSDRKVFEFFNDSLYLIALKLLCELYSIFLDVVNFFFMSVFETFFGVKFIADSSKFLDLELFNWILNKNESDDTTYVVNTLEKKFNYEIYSNTLDDSSFASALKDMVIRDYLNDLTKTKLSIIYENKDSHLYVTYFHSIFVLINITFSFIFEFVTHPTDFKKMSEAINSFGIFVKDLYFGYIGGENLGFFIFQRIYKFFLFDADISFFYLLKYVFNLFCNNLLVFNDFCIFYFTTNYKNHLVLDTNNSIFSYFYFFFAGFQVLLNIISELIFNIQFDKVLMFFYDFFYFFKKDINLFKNYNRFFFNSDYFNVIDSDFKVKTFNQELSNGGRHVRFDSPIFKYDYKSGDYFPKLYKEVYSYLFSSFIDLTGGLRQAPWFISPAYAELLNTNFSTFFESVSTRKDGSFVHLWTNSRFNNSDAFFNIFHSLSFNNNFLTHRWVSINTLNQKFYKMFHTSSMQQRIYSNWRQLKFTREAWRCKLLSARHQKTLFRRYVNEDGVFWSIERNAKDLLPGWAMITPFSSRTRFTAIGKVDIGLMGVLLVLNSSIISSANFLVTYRYLSTLNNRKMRDARAFFTEAIMVSSWMMIAANPMLVIGIIMLLSDRHWQTSFFDYSGGGDTVLFQHMFWFFGHPEVYIIIIPTFGFTNTIISYYLRKRVSARASLMYSMYTIAFLGFFVWGHHMYMVGLAHTTRMLFSTLTVMISVPAATKIMHWCVTLVNSAFAVELPLLFVLTFVFFFVSGGISGMAVAHTGMDVLFHDTFYVIGHFHVMLAGAAMFASFGAFYFYFVSLFGVKYSRIYAYLHFTYYLLGQLFTVIPMLWLGYAGMPRRVLDYPTSMGGWHSVISGGHMLSVAGLISFFIMIFDSLRQAKAVVRNTFGVGRFNTRINFYFFEIAKLEFVQNKSLFFFRIFRGGVFKLNDLNYFNFESLETTLYSYSFAKRN